MGNCTTKPVNQKKKSSAKEIITPQAEREQQEQKQDQIILEKQPESNVQAQEYGEVIIQIDQNDKLEESISACQSGLNTEQIQCASISKPIEEEVAQSTVKEMIQSPIEDIAVGVIGGISSPVLGAFETETKRSNSCGENPEEEGTYKQGFKAKGHKYTVMSLDQYSTSQFTGAHNDILSKKDCISQSETATSNKTKVKRCLMQSTHEQSGITLMIYEPTQNSEMENGEEGSFSINEDEDEEEEEEKEVEQEEDLDDPNEEDAKQKNEHFQKFEDDNQTFTIFYAIVDRNNEDGLGSKLSIC